MNYGRGGGAGIVVHTQKVLLNNEVDLFEWQQTVLKAQEREKREWR